MKKNLLFSILLFVVGIIVLPQIALAQPTTITQMVTNLASLISGIAVFITIACWIITGLLFLMAQGDPSKLTKAKTALIWAVVGTAVAILSATAVAIINNALTFGF